MTHVVSLTVKLTSKEDKYLDRVRIPAAHRGTVREGKICRLSVKGKAILVEVRGIPLTKNEPEPGAVIQMDEITRANLIVFDEQPYQFTVTEVWWINQFCWAWNASDPTPRIAARLGVVGVALGVLGAVLGAIALWK